MTAPVLGLLRGVRHTPDRLLHQLRRDRLVARLRAAGRPHSVLFVCLGNINRSAFAAALFEREIAGFPGAPIRVRSAGFIGPGRPSPAPARVAATARGVDLSPHVSRLLDLGELRETALIVVMDRRQQRNIRRMAHRGPGDVILLGDLDPDPIRTRTLRDPYGQEQQVFEDVFDRIERCVRALVGAVTAQDSAP